MQQIELYSKLNSDLHAMVEMGTILAKSGLFGFDRVEQGIVMMVECRVKNMSPNDFGRIYDVIGGKIRKKALAGLADFRRAGGKHKWLKTGDDGLVASIELTYEGQTLISTFTIDDARKAQLVRPNSNWEKTPSNMLRARAISNGVAMMCPEIYTSDDDSEPRPLPEINLAAAKEVKAEVVVEATPVEAIVTPLPQQQPETAAATESEKPFQPGPAYSAPAGTQLPAELVTRVEAAIGERAIPALKWMIKEGWLQQGQGIESLTEYRAKRILKNTDSFIRAITEGK